MSTFGSTTSGSVEYLDQQTPDEGGPDASPWQETGHFWKGDPIMLGGGDQWYPLTVEADDYANGGQYLPGHAQEYRHGGRRCDSCTQDVARQQAAATAAEDTYRATFSDRARELADILRDGLELVDTDGRACGHGDVCRLDPDVPLPAWLHTALAGARFTPPEGPWPNFARTASPVNWPALIQDHTDWLVPDHDMLEGNYGARWPGITASYALLAEQGHHPTLDVALWVLGDGQISVEPLTLVVTVLGAVSAATVGEIDDLLVAAGREREALHEDSDSPAACWTLTC